MPHRYVFVNRRGVHALTFLVAALMSVFSFLTFFLFSSFEQPEPMPRRGRAAVPPPEPREQAPRSCDAPDTRAQRDAPARDTSAQEQAAVCGLYSFRLSHLLPSFSAQRGTECEMELVSR